jgi:hypothetical protein
VNAKVAAKPELVQISTAYKQAAHVYGIDTEAVALGVKQEFASKEKARKAIKPGAKLASKSMQPPSSIESLGLPSSRSIFPPALL